MATIQKTSKNVRTILRLWPEQFQEQMHPQPIYRLYRDNSLKSCSNVEMAGSLLLQVDNGLRNYYRHKNVPYDQNGVSKFCEWADENGYFIHIHVCILVFCEM